MNAVELAILDLRKYGELDASTVRALRDARYTADQIIGDWFPPDPPPVRPRLIAMLTPGATSVRSGPI